jgi:hypothetical protein
MYFEQLGIAAEHLQGAQILRVGYFRPGGCTASGFGQGEQSFQTLGGGFGFFAVLRGDARFLEQCLEVEPLPHIERRYVDIETGHANLVLRQRCLHRLAVVGGAQVARHKHDEQRAVDSVLRPAEGRRLEQVAQILALLASADGFQHTAADWVLSGVAGVANLRERSHIAAPGTGDHLPPVAMVSLAKLREQPHQGAAGGILNLVGQLDAVGFLSATEERPWRRQ